MNRTAFIGLTAFLIALFYISSLSAQNSAAAQQEKPSTPAASPEAERPPVEG